jgi:outer membrane protein/protease secretion system outer membrane protein
VNIPLFAGGYVNSTVRQAAAEKVRADENLEAARRDLAVRVHREHRGVAEGVLRVRALEQAVRSAQQLVTSSKRSFEAGSRTTVDVLNAEQQLQSTLRDLAEARYLYLVSRVRLRALVGMDRERSIEEVNGWLRTSEVTRPN